MKKYFSPPGYTPVYSCLLLCIPAPFSSHFFPPCSQSLCSNVLILVFVYNIFPFPYFYKSIFNFRLPPLLSPPPGLLLHLANTFQTFHFVVSFPVSEFYFVNLVFLSETVVSCVEPPGLEY